jgi:hypothetical protein
MKYIVIKSGLKLKTKQKKKTEYKKRCIVIEKRRKFVGKIEKGVDLKNKK